MKIISPILLFAACFLLLRAETQAQLRASPEDKTQLTVTSADADFAALKALGASTSAKDPSLIGRAKFLTLLDRHAQMMRWAALTFYQAHPADSRRWIYVLDVLRYRDFFIKGFKPEVETVTGDGWETIITDEPAKEFWIKQKEEWRDALIASTDATIEMKEEVEWDKFVTDFHVITDAKEAGKPYDYRVLRPRFDAHLAKYGELPAAGVRAADYLEGLDEDVPGSSEEIWQQLKNSPSASVREIVAKRARLREQATKPVEMTFTAVDGRAVDLKSLRGKVVLIDFWATWCGPCKEEIPNVKKVYAAYHDKGFEVVGIALEDGRLLPKDTPEQHAAKMEKAKKVLTDFTTANAMPWPQYFDGKFWKNDFSTQYAIQSIPAMFLLDQDGKVVSTNARGEKLEQEVKRLLKL